ncbi:MAG: acyl-CoA/acyl-ACP dehydrogenase [Gammaproteobacteria bacterium]|nr:acyl-CoA/acyl-ACP dehydrogenase [Gammaproteobacteria bacterium]
MDFALTEEHKMIVESVRAFVEKELYPYEDEVEKTDTVRPELIAQIKQRAKEQGFYAANMPEELGGGGLDSVSLTLMERELGRANFVLQYTVARPSNILQACVGAQIEEYLLPTIRGERTECLAMTEPDAGSDLRSMKCSAVRDGDDYVINGTKHFISHADLADYVILFAASGEEDTPRGKKKKITSFLIDKGTAGFNARDGYHSVSHRGYHNCILEFDNCRVPVSSILGEEHCGFDVANDWLGATRLQVAAMCLGRAYRALELSLDWAANRKQFGQTIGKFQGVSFKLADMAMQLEAAELLTLKAAWLHDQGAMSDQVAAMAKLYATEMLSKVSDDAIQIHGGMGLMADLPLERIWRDHRVERIWEGTSEIQRHIISRALLRPHES